MSRKKLILVVSDKMGENKKKSRNENSLVRMSKATRKNMDFNDDKVEIYPADGSTKSKIKGNVVLDVFHAFKGDIKALKESGEYTPEELKRVGFVTKRTFKMITGKQGKNTDNIWVSDSIYDTVIGADPEFLLFHPDGSIIRANNVMNKSGNLGSDGAMAEIRPEPSIHTDELIENMRKIFSNKNITKKISDYDWKSGCYFKDDDRDYPIGGHIHIGNPARIAKWSQQDRLYFFRVMNKIIDELLAIPMIKLDGDLGNKRRTKCTMGKYGYFGEMRQCEGRLEHRTLSGMWLTHPSLAKAVFGTARAIIDEVFQMVADKKFNKEYILPSKFHGIGLFNTNFKSWGSIPLAKDMGCTTSSKVMHETLNESKAGTINKTFVNNWLKRMKGLNNYKNNQDYIEALAEILRLTVKDIGEIDKNIKENWLNGNKFVVDL